MFPKLVGVVVLSMIAASVEATRPWVVPIFLLALVVVFVVEGVRVVPQQNAWVVERLGRFHAILEPGLNIIVPFFDRVAYHDYEGPATNLDERRRLAEHLGDRDVMFLRNHGTLVVGRTVQEAFNIAFYLEQGCLAQVLAMNPGQKLVLPSRESAQRVETALRPNLNDLYSHKSKNGMREWPAMLRLLNRTDPSYAS